MNASVSAAEKRARAAAAAAAKRERRRQRRLANPEIRAREAESKRRRRAANLEAARQYETEKKRQRRLLDPEFRAREAELRRRRRAANLEVVRRREAEAKRRRRAANLEAKRKQRAANLEAARQCESAAKATQRMKQLLQPGPDGADAWFKLDFVDRSFGHICKVASPAQPTGVLRAKRSVQHDQPTSCEKGVSKSTQANIVTQMVSAWTQSEEVQDLYDSSSPLKVPQPSKGHKAASFGLQRTKVSGSRTYESHGRPQCIRKRLLKR